MWGRKQREIERLQDGATSMRKQWGDEVERLSAKLTRYERVISAAKDSFDGALLAAEVFGVDGTRERVLKSEKLYLALGLYNYNPEQPRRDVIAAARQAQVEKAELDRFDAAVRESLKRLKKKGLN